MQNAHPVNEFEHTLARHCAPVLLGKKPAALLSKRCLPECCAWPRLRAQGFRTIWLHRQGSNTLVLIYHPERLWENLEQEQTRRALFQLGYPVESGVHAVLGFLYRRFSESADFPHEVGFFLGYPPEDVLAFMNGETDCKLCGAWKVFGDAERAAARFAEYARCRSALLSHLEQGGSILTTHLPGWAV